METYLNKEDIDKFVGQCIATSVSLLVKMSYLKEKGLESIETNELYKELYSEIIIINKIVTSLDEYSDFLNQTKLN
jgi:hypothetical protein